MTTPRGRVRGDDAGRVASVDRPTVRFGLRRKVYAPVVRSAYRTSSDAGSFVRHVAESRDGVAANSHEPPMSRPGRAANATERMSPNAGSGSLRCAARGFCRQLTQYRRTSPSSPSTVLSSRPPQRSMTAAEPTLSASQHRSDGSMPWLRAMTSDCWSISVPYPSRR